MSVADPIQTEALNPSPSFLAGLWQRWLKKRRRDRARTLSHVRFRLTREGVHFIGILAFIFIGAVIRDISLLILLAGSMIGLLVLQWRFNTSTLAGLHVSRRLARSTSVGQALDVDVQLSNAKFWLGAWLVLVQDRVCKIAPDKQRLSVTGTALVDAVHPRGKADSSYRLEFHERGQYSIGPTTLSTRFPLGLGTGWRTIENTSSVLVHPARGELTGRIPELFQLDQHGQAQSSPKAGTQEGEFFGLRPWATGDSRRWIHWRTTARLGKLSVRQFERQQQRQFCVLLDLWRAGPTETRPVEEAVAFLATLAYQMIRQGRDKLAVGIAGKQTSTFTAIQSPVLVNSLLDALAVVEPSSEPDLVTAIQGLSVPILMNSSLVVVSTRADQTHQLLGMGENSPTQRLLAKARIRWINVTAGELEPYFQWI